MANYFLAPIGNDAPFFLPTGVAASGAKLFTYIAGSTTKQNTYTDNTGGTPNANPILLNSSGYPASGNNIVEIWGNTGVTYKFVLAPSTDSDPPASPYWTRDNIALLNDVSATASDWVSGPAPTYVSATSFTLVGDQTPTFTVGRRLKTTNTGGTVYSTILTSVFTSLTTITVVNDASTLDSGLSAVSYGLVEPTHTSLPAALAGQANGQITFPAAQNASTNVNTLDDYEEGTWTPTLVGTGGGPLTYTFNVGTYVKIGKLVHISAAISVSGGSGITGNVSIQTLPFTAQTLTNYNNAIIVGNWALTLDAGYTQVTAIVQSAGTSIGIFESGSTKTIATIPAASVGAGSIIEVSGCYIAAA